MCIRDSAESFPCGGIREFKPSTYQADLEDSIKSRKKINQEGLAYLNGLKAQVEKEMKEGKSHH